LLWLYALKARYDGVWLFLISVTEIRKDYTLISEDLSDVGL